MEITLSLIYLSALLYLIAMIQSAVRDKLDFWQWVGVTGAPIIIAVAAAMWLN